MAHVGVILYRDVSPLVQKRGWCGTSREESDRAIVARGAQEEDERRGETKRFERGKRIAHAPAFSIDPMSRQHLVAPHVPR